MYPIREKLAYSKPGRLIAAALRALVFKGSRVHWVQQALADGDFRKLTK